MKQMVLLSLILIVAVVLSAFLTTQSGIQIGKTDANRIFTTKCLDYNEKYSCEFQEVQRDPDFADFVNSCKTIYGQEREANSCLHSFCNSCDDGRLNKENLADSTVCESICESCIGSMRIGAYSHRSICCAQYKSNPKCASSPACSAC
jgi:hypothetical protein